MKRFASLLVFALFMVLTFPIAGIARLFTGKWPSWYGINI